MSLWLRALRLTINRISAAVFEVFVGAAASLSPTLAQPPASPRSIFVLRNNDIGDLLVVTPLFEALHRRFPDARIAVGVGDWSCAVLEGNPYASAVRINAAWFNKYRERAGFLGRLDYLRRSPEVQALAERRFDIGIDVLGSAWGSLLMLEAKISYRMGVRGYAGGHSAVQAAVDFDPGEHVGRSALRFAELLGATNLPPVRPQIFLSDEEREEGEQWWAAAEGQLRRPRVIVGPGGGLVAKCWPGDRFADLASQLAASQDLSVLVLAGPNEEALVQRVAASAAGARTFPQAPGLRQVFALVAAADLVVCNSSMLLHTAAAFKKPTVVLLGEAFASARQHQAQWGYPDFSTSLGKEGRERTDIYTAAEALVIVREKIACLEPAS